MKATADKKRTGVSYEFGDLVLVKLQPYRQNSAALRKHQKLGIGTLVRSLSLLR